MANSINELILDDPLSLSDQDIDLIIAYQRQQRANKEDPSSKSKAAKKETGPKIKLDGLIKTLAPKPIGEPFKRRV